jgi:hypothetical protein
MSFMFWYVNSREGFLGKDFFTTLIEVFRRAYRAVKAVVDDSEFVIFPELTHLPAGKPLRPFLLKGSLEDMPSHFDESIRYKWLEGFAKQFQDVEKRLNRLHFKSLGNILALQERIGASADKL